jgi:hypothetical protein
MRTRASSPSKLVIRPYDWPEFRPRALLERLVAGRIDFVVIGGLAAVLHGGATFTRDLDITYGPDAENLNLLRATLVSLDARVRSVAEGVPFVPDDRTLDRTGILALQTAHGRLDLVPPADGFDGVRERAWRADLGTVEVQVASLEDLIAMKKAAGRPKDLVAVEELEVIQRLQRERN